MKYDIYLSYSGRKHFLECPKEYKLGYVDKIYVPEDPRNTLFGHVMGKVFERFYGERIWSTPDPVRSTLAILSSSVEIIMERRKIPDDFDPAFVASVRDEASERIPGVVEAIRKHKLLAPVSRSEVDLTVDYQDPATGVVIRLGGRTDFIHYLDSKVAWIIDGKGSAHRETYVDTNQLVWYATQHYLKYHLAPSRLGFLYYRFPKDPIQWIEYGDQDMRSSIALTVDVVRRIRLKMFDPTPSPSCKRCNYRDMCPEGQEFLADRQVNARQPHDNSVFDLESVM